MPSLNTDWVLVDVVGADEDSFFSACEKLKAHWHEYAANKLTNRTGAGVVAGDVVALSASNAASVALSDVVGSHETFVVAQDSLANVAEGEFARAGLVSCKSTGTINNGEYIRKSATTKAVESTGIPVTDGLRPPDGAIGYAAGAASGGFVVAMLYGFTAFDAPYILYRDGHDVTVAASSVETTLLHDAVSLPAGALGTLGEVEFYAEGYINGDGSGGESNGTVTFRIYYGASVTCTITYQVQGAGGNPSSEAWQLTHRLSAHNAATDSQKAITTMQTREPSTSPTKALTPVVYRGNSAEDSTAAKALDLTVDFEFARAGTNITCEHVMIIVKP